MSHKHRDDYAGPNEHDFANVFEEQPQRATSGSSSTGAPLVPKPSITSFQPRALQPPVLYIPRLGERRRAQRRADRQIAALRIASTVAAATADFEVVLAKAEEARQQREMVEQRR